MSLNYIAVEGCTLEFQNGGTGTITITPGQTSTKVKADGKAVYLTLKFTVSGYTGGKITVPRSGTGSGEITAGAEHVKIEGHKALLEGNVSAEFTVTGQKPSGSSTVTATNQEVVKITKAGQSKAKGA